MLVLLQLICQMERFRYSALWFSGSLSRFSNHSEMNYECGKEMESKNHNINESCIFSIQLPYLVRLQQLLLLLLFLTNLTEEYTAKCVSTHFRRANYVYPAYNLFLIAGTKRSLAHRKNYGN